MSNNKIIARRMGDVLIQTRSGSNLTQIEFSKRVGCTQGYLSKLERGAAGIPNALIWLRFCKAFGVKPTIVLSELRDSRYAEKKRAA